MEKANWILIAGPHGVVVHSNGRIFVAHTYYTYGSTYSRNGSNVPYMQYKMFTFIKLQ